MSKPEYDHDDLVRVQKVGGASIELHGKFAGDVIDSIKNMSLIDLGKAVGHYVLRVTGGRIQPKEQTTLNLKVDKSKQPVAPQQLVADIAPSKQVMDEFKKLLAGMIIMDAGYDQASGLYTLTVSNGKKKAKEWQLKFVNCTATEILPQKKKTIKPGRTIIVPGEKDVSLEACLYDALMQGGRQHDLWSYLVDNGADNEHLLTHVMNIFGKKSITTGHTIRKIKCEITGGKSPKFMWNAFDDVKRMEVSGKTLLALIRSVMEVSAEMKKKP